MNRTLSLSVIPLMLACRAAAADQPGQLDASRTLFSVLAAINAAGYDADLDSPANHPLRRIIREEIAKKKLPVVEDLKYFYGKHRRSSPTYDLSQYISFALSVNGPPNFENKFRKVELPPDVEALEGFQELMVKFDKEANIEDLWKRSQPAFDRVIEQYHEPVAKAVLEVNAYLRNTTSGFLGRRFQIYIDLLGAPNQIQVRGYVDDYYIVLTPSPEPQIDDVRHAYLSYLIDPPGIKYSDLILKKRGLIDYVQNAPGLPELYKADFLLLTTKSLIKAIESRLSPGNRQQLVDEALREGYILTPHFAEQLAVFEKQQESMRIYFPELIKSINLKKEEARLADVKFSEPRVRKARTAPAPPPPPAPSGPRKTLEDAENAYRDRDLEKAKQLYGRLLEETEEKNLHASSYYGLARIAILQKDPELAERLFQKALSSSPDAQVRAWVEVYLGRLSDAAGERGEAVKHYKEALAVEGGSAAAKDAAQKGMQQTFTK
ncbi:MAG TPA: tetratricopeptide repeat protein [Bryobacteraceae bacterium]|nr:tetratricopeptide repeat protein [Bryobacteraceae bacterium]